MRCLIVEHGILASSKEHENLKGRATFKKGQDTRALGLTFGGGRQRNPTILETRVFRNLAPHASCLTSDAITRRQSKLALRVGLDYSEEVHWSRILREWNDLTGYDDEFFVDRGLQLRSRLFQQRISSRG